MAALLGCGFWLYSWSGLSGGDEIILETFWQNDFNGKLVIICVKFMIRNKEEAMFSWLQLFVTKMAPAHLGSFKESFFRSLRQDGETGVVKHIVRVQV